ncbi:sulfatase [bacterium]|nr:sulfatase [bacterium]
MKILQSALSVIWGLISLWLTVILLYALGNSLVNMLLQQHLEQGLYLIVVDNFVHQVFGLLLHPFLVVLLVGLVCVIVIIFVFHHQQISDQTVLDYTGLIRKLALFLLVIYLVIAAGLYLYGLSLSKQNIILISIDTLRADHLGCYGYSHHTSPTLDFISRKGVLFEQCFSLIPITTPSHASLFTSLYPLEHGVLANNFMGYYLKRDQVTLAEVLLNAGYNTAAIVSAHTMRRDTGLDQGFQIYNDFFDGGVRPGSEVNRLAYDWLSRHRHKPFFLFLHYYEPHGPYNPPFPYNFMYDYTFHQKIDLQRIPFYQRIRDIADPSFYTSQYNGEIRLNDDLIWQLLCVLDRLDLTRNTMICITSDHGETLNERFWCFDHGHYLYDEQIQVPFILKGASGMMKMKGMISHELVQLIDFFPTVLGLHGLESPTVMEGSSLLPLIDCQTSSLHETILCETAIGKPTHSGHVTGVTGKHYALRTKTDKIIYMPTRQGLVYQQYDLVTHPAEDIPNNQNPDLDNHLMVQLGQFIKRNETAPSVREAREKDNKPPSIPQETIDILRAIGYIE